MSPVDFKSMVNQESGTTGVSGTSLDRAIVRK